MKTIPEISILLLLALVSGAPRLEAQSCGPVPPTITCPPNVVAECTGGLTPATYTVTAVDGGGAPIPVTCVPPSGTGFRLGTSNVVCTATDTSGQTASCSFTVKIADTAPPIVTCPSNITAAATAPSGAVITYIAAASDPCGIASFECLPPSGSTFPIGATTVTCTATDGTGNANACTFTVTVDSVGCSPDTTPPTIVCPTAPPQCIDPGTCLAVVSFIVGVSDNCTAVPTLVCNPPSGSAFPIGTTTVTCVAQDTTGNTSDCSFVVTVNDCSGNRCPHPLGFWKNHPGDWPVTSLTLGTQTYNQTELLALLKSSTTSDASLILARQLISALLNTANGSSLGPVCDAIANANNLFSGITGKLPYKVKSSSATGKQMVAVAAVLDRYNNGGLTPGCSP